MPEIACFFLFSFFFFVACVVGTLVDYTPSRQSGHLIILCHRAFSPSLPCFLVLISPVSVDFHTCCFFCKTTCLARTWANLHLSFFSPFVLQCSQPRGSCKRLRLVATPARLLQHCEYYYDTPTRGQQHLVIILQRWCWGGKKTRNFAPKVPYIITSALLAFSVKTGSSNLTHSLCEDEKNCSTLVLFGLISRLVRHLRQRIANPLVILLLVLAQIRSDQY